MYEIFLKCDVTCPWTPPLSQTVTPSRTPSPSSVTYFTDGPQSADQFCNKYFRLQILNAFVFLINILIPDSFVYQPYTLVQSKEGVSELPAEILVQYQTLVLLLSRYLTLSLTVKT